MPHRRASGRSARATKCFAVESLEPRRLLLAAPALAGLYHEFIPFSQPRDLFATATVGDDTLYAGGNYLDAKNNPFVSDAVDIYNAKTGQWSATRLSQPRTSIHAVAS